MVRSPCIYQTGASYIFGPKGNTQIRLLKKKKKLYPNINKINIYLIFLYSNIFHLIFLLLFNIFRFNRKE